MADIQWLPASIKFDSESAFPKPNSEPDQPVQFISCARENFILVWEIHKFNKTEAELAAQAAQAAVPDPTTKKPGFGYGKKKQEEEVAPKAVKAKIGRYSHLNEKWSPMYKILFREPQEEEDIFLMCIQGFVVLDRPELMEQLAKKTDSGGEEGHGAGAGEAREVEGEDGIDPDQLVEGLELEDPLLADDEEEKETTAQVKAVPTFILVGTLQVMNSSQHHHMY